MSPPLVSVGLGGDGAGAGADNDKAHSNNKKTKGKRVDCPTCGMKMYKVSANLIQSSSAHKNKQTPVVNKNGKVACSRCLMALNRDPTEEQQQPNDQQQNFQIPKFIITSDTGDDESVISDITLDRRLQQSVEGSSLASHAPSRGTSNMNSTGTTAIKQSCGVVDQDYESLTESDNDDDGGTPKNRKMPQHRSGQRSMNNSSHHNLVSLGSSARNRWGESLTGLDADSTVEPRPLPPKRVPSSDGGILPTNPSVHQQLSVPSRVTVATVCNTTTQTATQQTQQNQQLQGAARASGNLQQQPQPIGSPSPRHRTGSQDIAKKIVSNTNHSHNNSSTHKKSSFTPPWSPRQVTSFSNMKGSYETSYAGKSSTEEYNEEKTDLIDESPTSKNASGKTLFEVGGKDIVVTSNHSRKTDAGTKNGTPFNQNNNKVDHVRKLTNTSNRTPKDNSSLGKPSDHQRDHKQITSGASNMQEIVVHGNGNISSKVVQATTDEKAPNSNYRHETLVVGSIVSKSRGDNSKDALPRHSYTTSPSKGSGSSNYRKQVKSSKNGMSIDSLREIHVDLTSLIKDGSLRETIVSSSSKTMQRQQQEEHQPKLSDTIDGSHDLSPSRASRRQNALKMLVQMEQFFPPSEHVTSMIPPKKVPRVNSNDVDLSGIPRELNIVTTSPISAHVYSNDDRKNRYTNEYDESYHDNNNGEAIGNSNLYAAYEGGSDKNYLENNIVDYSNKPGSPVTVGRKNVKQLLGSIVNQESPELRINTLLILRDLMWGSGSSVSRKQFANENGVEVISTILWTDMMHPNVQAAVFKLLFALAAGQSEDRESIKAPLADDGANDVVDALLGTMEHHAPIVELQLLGCQVLCCLASELSSSFNVNDGTRSGRGCVAVLMALEAHKDVIALQEWGIRALYNQCVHSKYADTNKRTIVTAKMKNSHGSQQTTTGNHTGSTSGHIIVGNDILLRILKTFSSPESNLDYLLAWICRLYRVLSSTRKIVDILSPATDLLRTLIDVCRNASRCRNVDGDDSAGTSTEIVADLLYILSSFLNNDQNKAVVNATTICLLTIDTMNVMVASNETISACCSILSKLVSEQSLRKDALLDVGVVHKLLAAMLAYPSDIIVQEASLRALACLSIGSDATKEQLCADDTLERLMNLCQDNIDLDNAGQNLVNENMCSLIASLYASDSLQDLALRCKTLSLLQTAMERSSSNTQLQEASVVALMNLSIGKNVEYLVNSNLVELIVSAMEYNKDSVVVQTNACCALWNIGVQTKRGCNHIIETNGIDCIVACMHVHAQNKDVVEMACGSLWGLSHKDNNLKNRILSIPNVTKALGWILVLHPNSPSLQEKASGVLAALSTGVCDSNVEFATVGISNLIEAVVTNPQSIPILQSVCRFFNQFLVHGRKNNSMQVGVAGNTVDACEIIPIIIHALEQCQDRRSTSNGSSFHLDVCNLLLTMAERSETAKERILSEEYVTIMKRTLDILLMEDNDQIGTTTSLHELKKLVESSTKQ